MNFNSHICHNFTCISAVQIHARTHVHTIYGTRWSVWEKSSSLSHGLSSALISARHRQVVGTGGDTVDREIKQRSRNIPRRVAVRGGKLAGWQADLCDWQGRRHFIEHRLPSWIEGNVQYFLSGGKLLPTYGVRGIFFKFALFSPEESHLLPRLMWF